MVKINDIKLSRLRNDIHYQYCTDFRTQVIKYNPMYLKVETMFNTFQLQYEQEGECLKQILRNEQAEKLNNADWMREVAFERLLSAVATARDHFDPKVSETAARLQKVTAQYRSMSGRTMESETLAVAGLIRELRGKYPSEVNVAGLQAWVNELESHNRFMTMLLDKQKEQLASHLPVSIKPVRRETDRLYQAIVDRLNALMLVEPNPNYEQFIHEQNGHIDRYARWKNLSQPLPEEEGKALLSCEEGKEFEN
jgi:hypothetical protein